MTIVQLDETTEGSDLLGRDLELATLRTVVEAASTGERAVRVVTGEVGIGKSALLRALVAPLQPHRSVVEATGVETEIDLGYAALHRLARPLMGGVPALPPPQRSALEVAFGLRRGDRPDRFCVGLAVLNLLTALAAPDRPVVLVIDDAHWIDRESIDALGFVARRLLADPVAALFAVRDGHPVPALEGLPTIPIAGLDDGSARALIRRLTSRQVSAAVEDRIISETGGNPLAIAELVTTFGDDLARRGAVPAPLPLGRRLQVHFAGQVAAQPPATRLALGLLACDPHL